MKRSIKKTIIAVIVMILMIILSLILWQRENIMAFYNSRVYTSEEIAKQLDESKEKAKKELEEKYPSVSFNDISAEDELKLMSGEISLEEISEKYDLPLAVLKDDTDSQKNGKKIKEDSEKKEQVSEKKEDKTKETNSKDIAKQTNNNVNNSTKNNNINTSSNKIVKNNQSDEDKVISNHVGRLYGIKARYLSKLGALESQAIAEYKNSNGKVSKQDIAYKYASIGGSYEGSCDSEVEGVLSSLQSELSAIGADTSVVSILRNNYYGEKQAKKAYYMSQF